MGSKRIRLDLRRLPRRHYPATLPRAARPPLGKTIGGAHASRIKAAAARPLRLKSTHADLIVEVPDEGKTMRAEAVFQQQNLWIVAPKLQQSFIR
jgi:hypothetical protein